VDDLFVLQALSQMSRIALCCLAQKVLRPRTTEWSPHMTYTKPTLTRLGSLSELTLTQPSPGGPWYGAG
jgi:hypothetical protein